MEKHRPSSAFADEGLSARRGLLPADVDDLQQFMLPLLHLNDADLAQTVPVGCEGEGAQHANVALSRQDRFANLDTGGGPRELDSKPGAVSEALLESRYAASS